MIMLDDDIMRQLRATFKVEAEEHIQAMNRILLALEKNPDGEDRADLLEEIFREAHSLKGAAGAADFGEVEATGHRLESVFGAAKAEEIELTADLCDVLYDSIDAVRIIIEAALEDRPHGDLGGGEQGRIGQGDAILPSHVDRVHHRRQQEAVPVEGGDAVELLLPSLTEGVRPIRVRSREGEDAMTPTPDGVPVNIKVPGSSVKFRDR